MEKTLTESEKVEQLMRPRYKVIADYPGNNMAVGKILTFEWHAENQRIELCFYYDKYPHLFRKLEWWEQRTPEEMPEYVKEADGTVHRITTWAWSDFYKVFYDLGKPILWSNRCTPATEQEYLTASRP